MTSSQPLRYQELADRLAELIQQGTYPRGERIPSVRQMSQQQRLSISTVLQAYYLLEDHGLIEARPQSGYYVRGQAAEHPPHERHGDPLRATQRSQADPRDQTAGVVFSGGHRPDLDR